jgi:hypothetical protein
MTWFEAYCWLQKKEKEKGSKEKKKDGNKINPGTICPLRK